MHVSIKVVPAVHLEHRVTGKFGLAEIIHLRCEVFPRGSSLASIGGVRYRLKTGGGTFSNANPATGEATYIASARAETVTIQAFGKNAPQEELGTATLEIVAPTSLKFTKVGNVRHTHGCADAGFRGAIRLQMPGLSYERLLVREGEFKGTGQGYYRALNGDVHPASDPIGIVNGNEVDALDTIYSGIQGQPWSPGSFEWHIPWQYQVIGTTGWTTFTYATHVQQINERGVVRIGKFNAGPFSAKPSDPDQSY